MSLAELPMSNFSDKLSGLVFLIPFFQRTLPICVQPLMAFYYSTIACTIIRRDKSQ